MIKLTVYNRKGDLLIINKLGLQIPKSSSKTKSFSDNQMDEALPYLNSLKSKGIIDYSMGTTLSAKEHQGLQKLNGGDYGVGGHENVAQVVTASRAPTGNDDDSDTGGVGYKVREGSYWVDTATDFTYVCVDASTGSADWDPVNIEKVENLKVVGKSGAEFTTVQSAANACVDGDSIVIKPGRYEEEVIVSSEISIVGHGLSSIIDGNITFTNNITNWINYYIYNLYIDTYTNVKNKESLIIDRGSVSLYNCIIWNFWDSDTGETTTSCRSTFRLSLIDFNPSIYMDSCEIWSKFEGDPDPDHKSACVWIESAGICTVINSEITASYATSGNGNVFFLFDNSNGSGNRFYLRNNHIDMWGYDIGGNVCLIYHIEGHSVTDNTIISNYINMSWVDSAKLIELDISNGIVYSKGNIITYSSVTTPLLAATINGGVSKIYLMGDSLNLNTADLPPVTGNVYYSLIMKDANQISNGSLYVNKGCINTTSTAYAFNVNGDISLDPGSGTYRSNDGTSGISGTYTTTSGGTMTIKNGIVTSIT